MLCVLGYAEFFCFNKLVQLLRGDFQFEDSFMRIVFQHSKPDIYRNGAWVVIAKTFKPACPVLLTLRYFAVASFSEDSEDFIFLPLTFCCSNGSYRFCGSVPLSYSRQDYGLYSLELETPLLQQMLRLLIDF